MKVKVSRRATAAAVRAGRSSRLRWPCRRPRRRTRGSARRVGLGQAPALQPRGADREERPDHDQDRDDGPDRVRDRLVRAAAGRLASAAWRRPGSGDSAVVTKVTWTGGSTPTGEDSLFQFLAQPASAKTYTFQVQQTYSDGSIVNWSGPESSEAPAPTIEVEDSLGGGGVSTLTIIALVVGVLGLLAGGVRARQRARGAAAPAGDPWRELAGADRCRAGRGRGRAGAAERRVGARVPGQDRPGGERRARRSAPERPADLRRGGRAAVRDHLGHQRRRAPGDDRPGAALARRTRTRWSCRCARTCPRAGT